MRGILRFLEDAAIEREPTELPVDEILRIAETIVNGLDDLRNCSTDAFFFSDVAWACGMFNDCRSAAHAQRRVSDRGRHVLVPDVFRNRGVNGILGNVGCVITDAFERARNQDQVKIPAQLLGILHHPHG